MTVREFDRLQSTLACSDCAAVGALSWRLTKWNHAEVTCGQCSAVQRIDGRPYLRQHDVPRLRAKLFRPEESVENVWSAYGNQCALCGIHAEELRMLGEARHRHHAPPIAAVESESECVLIPLCQACNSFGEQRRRSLPWSRRPGAPYTRSQSPASNRPSGAPSEARRPSWSRP